MDLRAIAYFATVAEYGTVRGAAARLGISQPALTKAIRRLEDEMGVVLFDRQARGVTPTAYGRTLLRHARNLQASLKEAREEIAALRAGIAGRVRIGAARFLRPTTTQLLAKTYVLSGPKSRSLSCPARCSSAVARSAPQNSLGS